MVANSSASTSTGRQRAARIPTTATKPAAGKTKPVAGKKLTAAKRAGPIMAAKPAKRRSC